MSKASTPKTRLQRTSNPTPPEPESSKKYKIDMSQNNPEMDFNITDLPIPQQFAISNEDIQKIADAVKSKLSEDIVKIINEKTAPLRTESSKMKSMLWSSMDAAALLEFPGFRNRRKKVTLPKKFAKSYLILTQVMKLPTSSVHTELVNQMKKLPL